MFLLALILFIHGAMIVNYLVNVLGDVQIDISLHLDGILEIINV